MRKISLFLIFFILLSMIPGHSDELPDLEVTDDDLRGEKLIAGSSVILYINIINKSNITKYGVEVRYALKNVETDIVEHQATTKKDCPANETTTIEIHVSGLSFGDYLFTAIVDPNNAIKESNEENNQAGKILHVQASDLTVTEITLSNPTPKVEEEIQISAEIKNIGETSTAKSFRVGFYEGNTLLDEREITSLDPGGFKSVFTYWTPKFEGEIDITVTVDLREMVDEQDETNNSATRTITVERIKAFILSNSIDWYLEGERFKYFLESNKIEVKRIFPNEFDSYENEHNIIILGGPDAYSGVGYIVSQVLDPDSIAYLRTDGAYNVFSVKNIFTAGQKIFVMAGNDRDLTAQVIRENKEIVLTAIKS